MYMASAPHMDHSWHRLGKSLHAPLYEDFEKSWDEYEDDYKAILQDAPDVVPVHGAPSREENLLRYDLAESHVHHLKKQHPRFDPTILIPDVIQDHVDQTYRTWLKDEEYDIQDWSEEADQLKCTVDDYESLSAITTANDRVDSVVSDYFRWRNRQWGNKLLDGEHTVLGAETERDSIETRLKELPKFYARELAYDTAGVKLFC